MATKMTKAKLWEQVLNIGKEFKLDEEVMKSLSELLEPKRGGGHSNRIIKEIDGIIYKNCRFTGKLWPETELIYQNEEAKEVGKDKGYSKVGISIWNKGQKYIKDLKNQMTEIILMDKPDAEKLEKLKNELKEIESKNLGNDSEWLMRFLTKEQEELINEQALPIE